MFTRHSVRKFFLTLFLSGGLFLALGAPVSANTLSVDDCIKCHTLEPQQIAEDGAAHQFAVNCLDCHTQHRPMNANNIPSCSDCHVGTDHYALDTCNSCHNPHKPLDITLSGELKTECISCHTQQGEEIVANPSFHSEVSCNYCHADTHGYTPDCTTCHASHSPEMVAGDCATCHAAHQPTTLEYPETPANQLCAACHSTAFTELQATTTKHSTTTCVDCHANQHAAIASCNDCHGEPHAGGIHNKFPNCGDCHNTAHDLNNLQ